MIAGILIGFYLLGVIITARVYVATDDTTGDRDESRFNATILGFIWPVALPIFAVLFVLSLPTLGVKTKRERQIEAETVRWEYGKALARIAELEREAGIREWTDG